MKISKSYSVDVLKYSFIMGCYYNEKRYISVLKHLNIKTLIYCSVSVFVSPFENLLKVNLKNWLVTFGCQ